LVAAVVGLETLGKDLAEAQAAAVHKEELEVLV